MRFAGLSPQHPTQKIVRHRISAAAAPDLHVLLLLLLAVDATLGTRAAVLTLEEEESVQLRR